MKKFPGIISRYADSIQMTIPYKGKKIYETITMKPTDANLKACFIKRCLIINELKTGTFNYNKHFPRGDNLNRFAKLAGDQINIHARLEIYKNKLRETNKYKNSTLSRYMNGINSIDNHFGKRLLSTIKRKDIQEWAATCDIVQKTLNNRMIHWHAIIKQAMANDEININILSDWNPEAKNISHYEKKPFSKSEVKHILKIIKVKFPDCYSFFLFRFALGMRPSEIFGLTWERYNEIDNSILIKETIVDGVHEKTPKTAAAIRALKLNKPAIEAIKIQKKLTYKKGGLIFINPYARNKNKEWNYTTISKRWKIILDMAHIEYRSPYATRHTFATLHLKADQTKLYDLSVALGHKDLATTTRLYIGTTEQINEPVTDALDNIFEPE